jgi:RNA polymerase sigma-70 factor (ECF subfamily)
VDDDIRAALGRGDINVAFRLVVQAHGKAVYTACYRILKNRSAAEDAMQQAMIAAFESHRQLPEVRQIRGWLIQIANRKCFDALRSSKRADRLQRDGAGPEAMDGGDVIEQLDATAEHRALEGCLAALPPDVAAAVLMRHHEGMSWKQIAEAVAMAPDAIRMQVTRRAMKSLRECLESKGITP